MKRSRFRLTPLQAAVHLAALTPFAWLIFDAVNGNLTVNPIQEASRRTGLYALILLLASLAVTPLNALTGFSPLIKMRRPLGLYAFFYAAVHLSIFIGVDYGFQWRFILPEITEKRYIIVGFSAFTILLA
ncbi:MAG TPA: ferric reductase-like transmembrane domain-containing protein, partial [Anaerolineaceae bacterium]|nr:ferric reductase-like transmembrane domain-containing protein [Anaerolineaceae bacterium]